MANRHFCPEAVVHGLGKPKLFVIIFQGYFGSFDFFDFFLQTEAKEEHGEFHKREQGQSKKGHDLYQKRKQ